MDADITWISIDKKKKTQDLPASNGVYLFRTSRQVLYVGKSINIRARVASHIENAKLDRKENRIIEEATEIGYFVTDSEFAALILESTLIRKHHPHYNVRWKDDKSYIYIKITKETYPKIYATRQDHDKKSYYFGPFSSTKVVRELLRSIRRVFPYCSQRKIGRIPCFWSKIGLCDPCPNSIEKTSDSELKKRLESKYKANIRAIKRTFEGKSEVVLKSMKSELKKLTLSEQFEKAIQVRDRIYRLEHLVFHRSFTTGSADLYNKLEDGVVTLEKLLVQYFPNLQRIERIECYDISNLSFLEATASMVVMTRGMIDKSQYRKFKISKSQRKSDFHMLDEALHRRFRNSWPEPDLIVVDGGKPQVRIALKARAQAGKSIPIIGLAKNPDRVVIGNSYLPTLRLSRDNAALNALSLLRDESHRFAKKYHLYLRSSKLLTN